MTGPLEFSSNNNCSHQVRCEQLAEPEFLSWSLVPLVSYYERDQGHILLRLEVNLAGQLDNSRRVRRLKQPEISVTQIVANVLELGMVEGVEGLQAKLQSAGFGERKGLEEREIPVVASRSA